MAGPDSLTVIPGNSIKAGRPEPAFSIFPTFSNPIQT
jgi:hypothetical protein